MSEERPRVVRIEIEFSDGTIRYGEDSDAEQVYAWYVACEIYRLLRGGFYNGPRLKEKRREAVQ